MITHLPELSVQPLWRSESLTLITLITPIHNAKLPGAAQSPQVNKDTLIGMAFQGLREHLPGAEDKGQTSFWIRFIPHETITKGPWTRY